MACTASILLKLRTDHTWISSILNLIKVGQEIWKVLVELSFMPERKVAAPIFMKLTLDKFLLKNSKFYLMKI